MEYCERSTLKDVIEDDLYKNEDLIWKLFREIVEGLVHIHEQVKAVSIEDLCFIKLVYSQSFMLTVTN